MQLKPDYTFQTLIGLFGMLILSLIVFNEPMVAQQVNPALVVPVCGTAPTPFPSSGRAALVVDVNGNLCAGVSVSATIATTGLAISVAQGASSVGVPITPLGGFASSTAPSYVQGTINGLSFDLSGNLRTLATVSAAADQTVSTTNSKGSGAVAVVGTASDGNATAGGPVVIAGISGTTVQTLEMNNQTPAGTEYGVITRNIPSGTQAVSGTVTVTDGAGALNVIVDSGTITATVGNTVDVNFRTSNIATNIAQVAGNTAQSASGALATVLVQTTGTGTVGGVLVNNGAGASAVNIQDGGNSITVDGTVSVGNTVNVNFLTSSVNVACTSGCSATGNISQIGGTNVPAIGSGLLGVQGAVSDGVTTLGNPVPIAGVDPAGKVQTLNVDGGGVLAVTLATTSGSNIVGGVNIAQYNGQAPVIVSGVPTVQLAATSGTGSIGVMTVTSGVNTGASVSTVQPVYVGGNGTGALFPVIACDTTVTISQASSGSTQLVALSAGKRIYICSYSLFSGGTVNVQLEDGTTSGAGAACTAGTNRVTGNYNFTAQTGISKGSGLGMVARTAQSAALCIRTSTGVEVDGEIAYTQFGLNWLGLVALVLWRRRRS